MKSREEIYEMIRKYDEKLDNDPLFEDEKQWMFGIVDALLWVVEDESGLAI